MNLQSNSKNGSRITVQNPHNYNWVFLGLSIIALLGLVVTQENRQIVMFIVVLLIGVLMFIYPRFRFYGILVPLMVYHLRLSTILPWADINAIVFGTGDSGLTLLEILLAVCFGLVILDIFMMRWKPESNHSGLGFWLGVSSLVGLAVWASLNSFQAGDRGWSGPIRFCLFPLVVPIILHIQWNKEQILKHVTLLGYIGWAICLAQWISLISTGELTSHSLFVMQFPMALALGSIALNRMGLKQILIILFFSSLYFFYERSLTPIVQLFGMCVAAIKLSKSLSNRKKWFIVTSAVLIAIIFVALVWSTASHKLEAEGKSVYTEETLYTGTMDFLTSKLATRAQLWKPAIESIMNHPFTPSAIINIEYLNYFSLGYMTWNVSTHNSYLDLLLILSLLAIPGLIIVTIGLYRIWKLAVFRSSLLGLEKITYALGIYLVGFLFSFNFGPQLILAEDAPFFWIAIGFLWSITRVEKLSKQE
jgi:hypothetical protein